VHFFIEFETSFTVILNSDSDNRIPQEWLYKYPAMLFFWSFLGMMVLSTLTAYNSVNFSTYI